MSAVALERPGAWRGHADPVAPSLLDDLGGEPTLDEVIAGVWEGLAAQHTATCPVCGSELRPDDGAQALRPDDSDAAQVAEAGGARRPEGRAPAFTPERRPEARSPEGGRCLGCDSTLS